MVLACLVLSFFHVKAQYKTKAIINQWQKQLEEAKSAFAGHNDSALIGLEQSCAIAKNLETAQDLLKKSRRGLYINPWQARKTLACKTVNVTDNQGAVSAEPAERLIIRIKEQQQHILSCYSKAGL
jgi:hypothetical protein